MSNRSETFGRLLKGAINSIATYEGKTAPIVEEELAEKVGLAGSAFQRYKSGYLPPDPRTIEIIAEAAVQRGFLYREWLQRFLHAARYHQADKLLDQLCPVGPARPRSPRVYQNLPAPTYSQFVMRQEAFAEILDGLGKRSAAVIIVGLGGNGKTSLAREIADYCLKGEDGQALFDAAVWVSDKDRPGTTNLSIVLDEIARTLDYPGFTQFEHDEKRREVEQLLRRRRVLVCIDNFETITDGALLAWLLNLPEPSKALITTREYRREYRRGGWPVELRGMSDGEARTLIGERLKVLRIDKLVSDLAQTEPLVVATGGNPKAIEMTLGLVKYERRPLQHVIDDLYAGRGELFDDLFTRAWSLLDEAARRVLLVMTLFPTSACSNALISIADVQGFAFARAIERLEDLALLDVIQADVISEPRYILHPLIRAYAGLELAKQSSFEQIAREKWTGWYQDLSSSVGYCANDLARLNILDTEQETAFVCLQQAYAASRYASVIQLAKGISYYYYVRGLWERKVEVDRLYAMAARDIGDLSEEAQALSYIVLLMYRQGRPSDVQGEASRILEIEREATLSNQVRFDLQHMKAMYHYVQGDLTTAQKAWQSLLRTEAQSSPVLYSHSLMWLSSCSLAQGKIDEARDLLNEALKLATEHGYERAIAFILANFADVEINSKNFTQALVYLESSRERTNTERDRPLIAEIAYLYGRLYSLQGDFLAACQSFTEAIDLFERLGMRRELAEAREELRRLDEMGEAPAT